MCIRMKKTVDIIEYPGESLPTGRGRTLHQALLYVVVLLLPLSWTSGSLILRSPLDQPFSASDRLRYPNFLASIALCSSSLPILALDMLEWPFRVLLLFNWRLPPVSTCS